MTRDEVLLLLRRAVESAGSQRKWAAAHGVSAVYVGDVLAGHREPGDGILRALGVERVVSYRATRPRTAP